MDVKVENLIKSCIPCQSNIKSTTAAPLLMTEMPAGVWKNLSLDFYGPLPSNEHLLVLIDDFSRYPVVNRVKNITAQTVVGRLDAIFTSFGIPKLVKTDNGPPFTSGEFKNFAETLGFTHKLITPYWPQANGEVERFMRTIGKVVRIAKLEQKPLQTEINKCLRNYCTTPHGTTNIPPADLMFKYQFHTKLPCSAATNLTS